MGSGQDCGCELLSVLWGDCGKIKKNRKSNISGVVPFV